MKFLANGSLPARGPWGLHCPIVIGVFDSGFGGLTVLSSLLERLPQYDYIYLADNARAPYGARSFEIIHQFTQEAVDHLFRQGCQVVILACNTASARALRTLQIHWLPKAWPDRRILGVVRPSVEALAGLPTGSIPGETTPSLAKGRLAVVATASTIASDSFRLELAKFAPEMELVQQACPLWVPLVENGELEGPGAEYYVRKYLGPLFETDTPPTRLLLGCTHYPLLLPLIRRVVPSGTEILPQGPLVAERFADWISRHREFSNRLGDGKIRQWQTTDDPDWFSNQAKSLIRIPLQATQVRLNAVS
jgi:glutamate racemase